MTFDEEIKDVLKHYEIDHKKLHDSAEKFLLGKEVIYKYAVNGIKNRKGIVRDMIFTYDFSLGIDLYRLDNREGFLDRIWTRPRNVVFQ